MVRIVQSCKFSLCRSKSFLRLENLRFALHAVQDAALVQAKAALEQLGGPL